MQHDKLKIVIENHAEWIKNPANGEQADLQWADLRRVNLQWADLRRVNLRGANLRWANLRRADLRGANLRGADLRWADLQWADLQWADLQAATINHCVGNMREIRSLQLDAWAIAFTADTMAIGCEQHAISDWWAFTDDQIARMDRQALTWWCTWKPVLQQIVAATESPDILPEPSDGTGT